MLNRLAVVVLRQTLAAVLALAATVPEAGARGPKASPKWLAVDEWSGSFTVDRNIYKTAELQGMTEVIEVREHISGKCSLSEEYTEEGFAS